MAMTGSTPNGALMKEDHHGKKSEQFIRKAVAAANPNALRLSLYQAIHDPSLEDMEVTKKGVRGGAMQDYILADEDQELVRQMAVSYLLSLQGRKENGANVNGQKVSDGPPSFDECSRLMNIFHGTPLDSKMTQMGYEELAVEEFPRRVSWNSQPSPEKLANYHVVIIGAGINGISIAISLKRLGIPFTLIDRQSDTGGTWMENSYPGARVDTLGFTFQYKFEQSYHWDEMFPPGPDIRRYLDQMAVKYDIKKHFLFEREVIGAKWEEGAQRWEITLKLPGGEKEAFLIRPNVIVSACGLFSTPNLPDIPGIHDYQGHMWHTTRWDHNVEYQGKNVAVIGNGSSGVQIIPGLARDVPRLGVYQRTPQWMSPYDGYGSKVPDELRWLLDEMPFYKNWNCYAGYIRSMQLPPLQVYDPEWRAKGGLVNPRNDRLRGSLTNYIQSKVGNDSPLLPKLIPQYAPLVRRLVVDNGFYEALTRDNVELFADGIERIIPDGIRSKDGTERKYDIIVLACGFQTANYLHPVEYVGRNGVTLDKTWEKDGARSYLGLTIPGYPNLFTMYGPNHQPRGGPSIHSWSEIWGRYIVSSITFMIENDVKSMNVKQSVYDEYNSRLDAEAKKLIWEADRKSYFFNKYGRQVVNVPWSSEDYHAMMVRPDVDDFNLVK